ncbi:hypothetical protein SNEBB_000131 [Seison nebaliae]|nr:hypothetical protein SNEBB_000131 [Seison nebaliae]
MGPMRRTFTKIPVVNHTPKELKKGILVLMNKDGSQRIKQVYTPLTLTRNIDKLLEINSNNNSFEQQKKIPIKGILKNRLTATEGMSFSDVAAMYFEEEERLKREMRSREGFPNIPGTVHLTEPKKLAITFTANQTENPNINLIKPKVLDLSIYKQNESLEISTKTSSTQTYENNLFSSKRTTSSQTVPLPKAFPMLFETESDLTSLEPSQKSIEVFNKKMNINSNNQKTKEITKRKRTRSSSCDFNLPTKIAKNNHWNIKHENKRNLSDTISKVAKIKTSPTNVPNNDDSADDAESLATVIEGFPSSPCPSGQQVRIPIISETINCNSNVKSTPSSQQLTETKMSSIWKPFARLGSVFKIRDLFDRLQRKKESPHLTDTENEKLESDFEETRNSTTTFKGIGSLVRAITSKKWIRCGEFLRLNLNDATDIGELWPIFRPNKGLSELTVLYQIFSIYDSKFFKKMKNFTANSNGTSNNTSHLDDMSGNRRLLYVLSQMEGWKDFCSWEQQIRCYIEELCRTGSINSNTSLGASYVPRKH